MHTIYIYIYSYNTWRVWDMLRRDHETRDLLRQVFGPDQPTDFKGFHIVLTASRLGVKSFHLEFLSNPAVSLRKRENARERERGKKNSTVTACCCFW